MNTLRSTSSTPESTTDSQGALDYWESAARRTGSSVRLGCVPKTARRRRGARGARTGFVGRRGAGSTSSDPRSAPRRVPMRVGFFNLIFNSGGESAALRRL